MALGLVLALVVNDAIRGRTFFRAAYYFPSLTSSAAITAIAIFILSRGRAAQRDHRRLDRAVVRRLGHGALGRSWG